MNNKLTADAVRMAYRLILGREPENQKVVTDHAALKSLDELRMTMMNSPEFKAIFLHSQFAQSKWVAVDVLDRFLMWVDLHDRYVSAGCLNNDWETEETSFVSSRLRAGDVFIDIGANIGWFTLVAAKAIGKHGTIHSFEPHPVIGKMLARTVAQNDLKEIVNVWGYALSDEPGEVFLNTAINAENPGGSFISMNDLQMVNHRSACVPAVRLDDLLPDVSPDFIKIDVEGAEPLVFGGAINALKRKKPTILSELFPAQLGRVSKRSVPDYIGQMEKIGYRCYLLDKGVPTDRLKDFPASYGKDYVSVVFEWRSH